MMFAIQKTGGKERRILDSERSPEGASEESVCFGVGSGFIVQGENEKVKKQNEKPSSPS
jgi:hypothetical protein